MKTALQRVREAMAAAETQAVIIADIVNIQWLTEFTGSSAIAVVTSDEAVFITDSRYGVQAQEQVRDFSVEIFAVPTTQIEVLKGVLERCGVKAASVESSATVAQMNQWQDKLAPITITANADWLSSLRMIKSPQEIARIERACNLADACFAHIQPHFRSGMVEWDLMLEIEFYMRRQGAKVSFEVIAVSGPNSAKPHGKPTERKLQAGDFVTVDFGAIVDMYCSDLTRTVLIGEPTPRHKQIYDLVLEGQLAAIDALKPGANGKDVDQLVRDIFDREGMAQYFGHSLGHGLGRAVHDPGGLSKVRDQKIEAGQVWTVEPGIYLDGWGGVRIEDDVVVTDSGVRLLTNSPKELLVFD